MGLCDNLLAQKKQLSQQINDLDTDIVNQWLACVAADSLPGGPAASNTVNDVNIRITELFVIYSGTMDQAIRAAAMNAIVAYQGDLDLLNQRSQVQSQLNSVVISLLQNNCPLE